MHTPKQARAVDKDEEEGLEVVDCSGVLICNDDIVCESGSWVEPLERAPLPIYPQHNDLPSYGVSQ